MTRTTREEMETTITFNRATDAMADLCTADPTIARRWKKLGYEVKVLGKYRDGEPRTWEVVSVPWKQVVSFKRRPPGSGTSTGGRPFAKNAATRTENPDASAPGGPDGQAGVRPAENVRAGEGSGQAASVKAGSE